MDNFGARIKAVRHDKGLSQAEFASALGISQGHVSNMERNKGDGNFGTLARLICKEYGVSEAWLRGEDAPMYAESQEIKASSTLVSDMQARELAAFDAMGGRAISAFADRMGDVRSSEGGNSGYESQGKNYDVLSGILDRISASGKLDSDEYDELEEATDLAIGEGQSIFYRFGLQDAFRLIFEAVTYARNINTDTSSNAAALSRLMLRLLAGTEPMMEVEP